MSKISLFVIDTMNNKEIYINGILVDLDEARNPIQLTYAINDLAELKDRQAYSTNTFKLPATARNLAACGFPDDPTLIQTQPYRKNSARIVQAGIEIIPNGISVITRAGKNIEVQILSGLIGFFDRLDDKNIRDLDLSAYDHSWNLQTVINSQSNTEGYVYPVIDYGGLSDIEREADVRQLRPATFRKTIIEAIIKEAGYTATGSYQSLPKYQNTIIPFTNDKFEHGKQFIDAPNTISASARNTMPQSLSNDLRDFIINFPDDLTTDRGNHWNGTEYTATDVAKVHVKLKYSIDIRDQHKGGSVPSIFVYVQVFRNGVWEAVSFNQHMAQGDFQSVTYADVPLDADIDLLPGYKIRVAAHSEPAEDRVLGVVHAGASINIEYIPGDVIYGQTIQLAATLPDITQKNFFKDFLQNFGLIVIPDNYRKTLQLINMRDVYANKDKAEDITDKLINTPGEIGYSLSNYGVNNAAKYKKDDAVPEGFGDGTMILDNQTLDQNVTLFTSVFAASTKAIKMSGINITQIKKIEDVTKSTEFKIKTEPRILLDQKINTQFRFFDDKSAQIIQSVSLPAFDGLEYNTLIGENYREIQRMLYRPFVAVKDILLKEIDISDIDWTIPVYDKKTASYYYRNEIKYIQGDVSTISLVRLSDIEIPKEIVEEEPPIEIPDVPDVPVDPDPGGIDPPVPVPSQALRTYAPYPISAAMDNDKMGRSHYPGMFQNVNMIVPENATTMGHINPSSKFVFDANTTIAQISDPNNYNWDFAEIRSIIAFGQSIGITKFHYAHVIWNENNTAVGTTRARKQKAHVEALNTPEKLEAYLNMFITKVFQTELPGVFTGVNVTNEMVNDFNDVDTGGLNKTNNVWTEVSTLERLTYVIIKRIRQIDPTIDCGPNDYNLETGNLTRTNRYIQVDDYLRGLNETVNGRQIKYDFIGFQTHTAIGLNLTVAGQRFKIWSDRGIKVYVSEFDTTTANPYSLTGPQPTMEFVQEQVAGLTLGLAQAYEANVIPSLCYAFGFWTLSERDFIKNNGMSAPGTYTYEADGVTKKSYTGIIHFNGIFDYYGNKKPAYTALLNHYKNL